MTYLHICKYANEENKNVSIALVVYYGVTYRTFKPKFEKKTFLYFRKWDFLTLRSKNFLNFFLMFQGT